MSFNIGSTNFGQIYVGSTRIGEVYVGSVKVYPDSAPDPYNPLNLPAYTMRIVYIDNYTPSFRTGVTGVQVSASPNVWDVTYRYPIWNNGVLRLNNEYGAYGGKDKVLQVLGANTQGVTSMTELFRQCTSLTDIVLFDTNSVTDMSYMFTGCDDLTSVPLYVTSSVTNMYAMFSGCNSLETCPLFDTHLVTSFYEMFMNCTHLTAIPQLNIDSATTLRTMFDNCRLVETGITAFYQLGIARESSYERLDYQACFRSCGVDTVTGSAELAQIPSSWK